jgi:hypothetical protein
MISKPEKQSAVLMPSDGTGSAAQTSAAKRLRGLSASRGFCLLGAAFFLAVTLVAARAQGGGIPGTTNVGVSLQGGYGENPKTISAEVPSIDVGFNLYREIETGPDENLSGSVLDGDEYHGTAEVGGDLSLHNTSTATSVDRFPAPLDVRSFSSSSWSDRTTLTFRASSLAQASQATVMYLFDLSWELNSGHEGYFRLSMGSGAAGVGKSSDFNLGGDVFADDFGLLNEGGSAAGGSDAISFEVPLLDVIEVSPGVFSGSMDWGIELSEGIVALGGAASGEAMLQYSGLHIYDAASGELPIFDRFTTDAAATELEVLEAIGAIGFDYLLGTAVPEPAASLTFAFGAWLLAARRQRRMGV